MNTKQEEIEYYLNLPWTYTIEKEISGGKTYYIIRVNELPGVCTDAASVGERMIQIKEAIHGAVELYLKNHEEIPCPISQ
jgi:predicted RNase H-like HicB family nuclease